MWPCWKKSATGRGALRGGLEVSKAKRPCPVHSLTHVCGLRCELLALTATMSAVCCHNPLPRWTLTALEPKHPVNLSSYTLPWSWCFIPAIEKELIQIPTPRCTGSAFLRRRGGMFPSCTVTHRSLVRDKVSHTSSMLPAMSTGQTLSPAVYSFSPNAHSYRTSLTSSCLCFQWKN